MVAANQDFIDSVNEMIAKVGELAVALESLPRDLTIRITYEEIGRPDVLSNESITRTIKDVNIPDRSAPESLVRTIKDVNVPAGATHLPPVTENIREKVTGGFGDLGQQVANIDAESRALQELNAEYANGAMDARQYIAAKRELVAAQFMEANLAARTAKAQREADAGLGAAITVVDELGASWRRVGGDGRDLSASMVQVISETNATTGAQQRLFAVDGAGAAEVQKLSRAQREGAMTAAELGAAIKAVDLDEAGFSTAMAGAAAALARANAVLIPFRAAANNAGGGMAALATAAAATRIPLGLAAFGITGWGTAIHLVIMAVAEFLAVFLPAMYAAAAGAYVMMQGVQLVAQHVNALYTATESLGPMIGKTAGDMSGLGHSMQTAQDLANPGVYELFGEALKAIGSQSKIGADGLSNLGRMGLEVTHMLDAFGAKVVADLQGPLGATLNKLLGQAVQDLREFGQILGNIGHAILMFAAAMPGAAELALRVATAISEVIKWVSQLPAPLLTAVLLFEELYRWSGILAGGFGLLGRGIALLGTLGIPVFIAIGRNIAQMLANLVLGVAGMVANLGGGLARVATLFSANLGGRIGGAVAGVVGRLGWMAAFLTGPWGVALGLGALATAGLVIWMLHAKDATQQWIDTSQKLVSSASNLQVLNVIAQQMSDNAQKIAGAQAHISTSNNQLAQAQSASAEASKKIGSSYSNMAQDINKAALVEQQYSTQRQRTNIVTDQAQTSIQQLTAYQRQLVNQNVNVLSGATSISKRYGVDFVTALGLADMAGVNLSKTGRDLNKVNSQASIQIDAMLQGYKQMDQVGGILANTMNAVNIQAGIQASKVQQTNQAWDQFIAMGTSLTGTYTQLNLNMQQMGNQAPAVGKKITAFSGQTQLSVGQIAQALTSFSGTSAQVWQSYNQSITQANRFTDALRVAAVAGVVSQKQYGQATASVVQQLEPYAKSSKAALSELMILSQEAGGPAYNSSKSLTANYKDLKNWTDKNAVSSDQFAGLLNTLTAKITNVSEVAKHFAGTLQTDVLNAVAAAGANTAKITTLTQAYTTALSQNGTQSPVTARAQDSLTAALKAFGFKASDITQIEQILTTTYGKNQAASNTLEGQTTKTKGAFEKYSAQLGINKTKADELWNNVAGKGVNTFNVLHSATDLSRTKFEALSRRLGITKGDADKLYDALHKLPPNTPVKVTETGTGVFTIGQSGMAGGGANARFTSGRAAGGLIPGYGGGDKHPALLEGGEAVVPKHLVHAIAPFLSAHKVPGFASGGIVDRFNGAVGGLGPFTVKEDAKFATTMTRAMESAITAAAKAAQQAATASQVPNVGSGVGRWAGLVRQALAMEGLNPNYILEVLYQMQTESGGNPNAINLTDSNAAKGDPSRGLMQTIMSTFRAYHWPGTSWNIYDPLANIAAALNYGAHNGRGFGTGRGQIGSGHGYDNGGFLMPGWTMAYNGTGQPERVVAPHQDGGVLQATIPVIVQVDGKQIFSTVQQHAFKYQLRNRGQVGVGGFSNNAPR